MHRKGGMEDWQRIAVLHVGSREFAHAWVLHINDLPQQRPVLGTGRLLPCPICLFRTLRLAWLSGKCLYQQREIPPTESRVQPI